MQPTANCGIIWLILQHIRATFCTQLSCIFLSWINVVTVEVKGKISCFTLQMIVCACLIHNYFLYLCSDDFLNATIAFLDLETWKMIYCMPHFVYYMQSYDFLLLFRRPSWIFAHNYFCPRGTEFGDFGQVTTCNKLSYDAKISFWQICSTSNAISPGL